MKRSLVSPCMIRFAISLLLITGLGCSRATDDAQKPVVRIGSEVITAGEYRDALRRLMPTGQAKGAEEPIELKKDLLNQLIEERLILKEAAKSGLSVSNQELSSEVEGVKKEYGDDTFKAAITDRYGTLDNWKEEIRKKLLVRKAIDRVVSSRPGPTDDEARAYYKEHILEYNVPEQARARMIVAATEEEARKIRAGLKASNFADVAKRKSLSPEKKDGGDLGFFSRGEMPGDFEDAVFKLKPGEISPVVKTEYGYHIFLLEEKKKGGRLKFNEVKDNIKEKLRLDEADAEVSNWISSLKKNEKIIVNERLL